jgi:hypothetical protein
MKKTLILTTALAGSLLSGAAAIAQTTVSGNLGISYITTGNDGNATQRAHNISSFGRESQINIANKGTLSNGLGYAAGFSLEFDGGDVTGATNAAYNKNNSIGQQQENVYIDFISGNTTVSVGVDHFQNTDAHMTNLVGFGYIGADGIGNTNSIYPTSGQSFYGNWGVGLAQKTTAGTVGFYYSPYMDNNATNDIGNAKTNTSALRKPSGYELTFSGDLGVKGLTVLAGYANADAPTAGNSVGGNRIAAKYNMGNFTVAVDDVTQKIDNTNDTNGRSYGIAYAVNKEISVGLTTATAERSGVKDEETHMIALGYNLGAVTVQAQYKEARNVGGAAENDGSEVGIYLGTRF